MIDLQPSDPVTSHDLKVLDAKITRLLPARYQHCYQSVPPTSMGSAGLKYAADGRVAWGEIWTSFCDLALAGGPPHRGRLLEPVRPEAVGEQPDRYRAVVDELVRAIRLTTAFAPVAGHEPGWVGVPCASLAEASWLRAAVVAENVSARVRGTALQLPAGPDFRAEKEIKNVVVALTKASHFWDGHLSHAQQAAFIGSNAPEPASRAEATSQEYGTAVTALERRVAEVVGRQGDGATYSGWVGATCESEEAAAWMLRATVVEGLVARREEHILYLPVGAGPASTSDRVADVFAAAWRLWRFQHGGRP
jgi:hypothetical protein